LTPYVDPQQVTFIDPPAMLSGGGGLTSTALDYWRFAQALVNGGDLDGARIIGRKTLELMTANHLPRGADLFEVGHGHWHTPEFAGIGFGLGFAVTLDPALHQLTGSAGEYTWSGAADTTFFVDPAEELVFIFMTQLMKPPSRRLHRELRTIVYGSLT
jgi:CubicO group peptidase (beta-lactamase class C family)